MTTTIKLHDVYIKDDVIVAEYDNVTQQIRPSTLADFILDNGLNWVYTEPDEYIELGVTMFMIENLREMVGIYLERNLA